MQLPRFARNVSLAALTAASIALAPQATFAQAKPVGLVVVAHGADVNWNRLVRETVAQAKWTHGPVRVAFLMGDEATTAGWDSAATQLEREGVGSLIVVPFMVSTWGSHFRQIQFYAGEIPALPPELMEMEMSMGHSHGRMQLSVPAKVTNALDDAPELGEALAARWRELSAADQKRPLMLIAHGPSDEIDVAHWTHDILATAKQLSVLVAPREVRLGLLRDDAAPAVRAASVAAMRDSIQSLARIAKDSVTVIPVLISTGGVNNITIPKDIEGLPVRYAPFGLAPHPALAKWIVRVAEQARQEMAASPQNKY